MFIETIFHHSLLNPRRAGTEEFYHILLVALEVLPWSEEDTLRSFHGMCLNLVEAVEWRELSSSVLLDGTSKACQDKLLEIFFKNIFGKLKYRVLNSAVWLENLINGVSSDPCVVAVLLLVIVVGVGGPQGLHLGPLPLLVEVVNQLISGNLNCFQSFSSHW